MNISHKTIVDVLDWRAENTPSKLAYRFLPDDPNKKEDVISYSELHERVSSLAHSLLKQARPGSRALLLMNPSLNYVISFYACLYAGIIAVPIYPPRVNKHLKRILVISDDANANLIFTTESINQRLNTLDDIEKLHHQTSFILVDSVDGFNDRLEHNLSDENEIAFLQYTSGSTGNPKGVMVTHKNIIANATSIKQFVKLDEQTRSVIWLPPFHDMGMIVGIIVPLFTGSEVTLMSPLTFLRNPMNWLNAISNHAATLSGGNNFAYDLCVEKIKLSDCENLDLSRWTVAFSGAEPVRAQTLTAFANKFEAYGFNRNAFYPCYGLAEATLMVSGGAVKDYPPILTVDATELNLNKVIEVPENTEHSKSLVGCGHADEQHEIVIVDPDTQMLCAEKTIGEIWVRGPSVSPGYYQKLKINQEYFTASLQSNPEKTYFKTGDLGFIYKQELYITGRIKDLIIIRGKNHYAHDIEETIHHSHPALEPYETAVIHIEKMEGDELIALCGLRRQYIKKINGDETFDEIIKAICQSVSIEHELEITGIYLLKPKSLSKTSSGKIQRYLAQEALIKNTLQVIRHWSKVLNVPDQLLLWLRSYAEERINSDLINQRRSIPPYIILDFGKKGLFGLAARKSYGGLEFNMCDIYKIMQQIAAIDVTLGIFVGYQNMLVIRPLQKYATESIKSRYINDLAAGRVLGALGVTEAEFGSNLGAFSTVAVKTATGWRLNGKKSLNSSGWANVMLVIAKTMDANQQLLGISVFVVTREMKGVSTGPETMTMGLRGMAQTALHLKDVDITDEYLLGAIGQGMEIIDDIFGISRLGITVIGMGAMKRSIQLMHEFAIKRQVMTGALAKTPIFTRRLSDFTAEVASYDALLTRIFEHFDYGGSIPPGISATIKVGGSESAGVIADYLIQFLGNRGYMENNIAPQILRDVRALRIGEGSNEPLIIYAGKEIFTNDKFKIFMSKILDGADLVKEFESDVAQIKQHYLNKQQHAEEQLAAEMKVYEQVGHLSLRYLQWAAINKKHESISEQEKQRLQAWIQVKIKQTLNKALLIENYRYILTHQEIAHTVKSYDQSIGYIQPGAPGEESGIDSYLLRELKRPTLPIYMAHEEKKPELGAAELESWLRNWIANTLKIAREKIDTQDSIFSYGIDSLSAIQLANDLKSQLDITVSPTLAWEYPKIEDLLSRIADFAQSPETKKRSISKSKKEYHPLTPDQTHFWIVEQLMKGTGNIMAHTMHIQGNLDEDKLNTCIKQIIEENPVLRASFFQKEEQVLQRVEPVEFVLNTLHIADNEQALNKVAEQVNALCESPFDLSKAPLFRIQLIHLNEQSHYLILVFHHIICDILSVYLFVDALSDSYKNKPRKQLPIDFFDYVDWNAEKMEQQDTQASIDFWRSLLEGAPIVHAIPLDYKRTGKTQTKINQAIAQFNQAELEAVKAFSKDKQVTLFIVLLAALIKLIEATSQQHDIVIGVPTSLRYETDLEKIIGLFARPLPYRFRLEKIDSIDMLLQTCKKMSLDALKRSNVTLLDIIRELKIKSGLGYSPLFQISVSYVDYSLNPVEEPIITPVIELGKSPGGLDLFFGICSLQDKLVISVNYDASLFTQQFAENLIVGYKKQVLDIINFQAEGQEHFKIHINSTFTADPMIESFDFWSTLTQHPISLSLGPYNQVIQELLNTHSEMYQIHYGLNILLVRVIDWLAKDQLNRASELIADRLNYFIQAVQHAAKLTKIPLIIILCPFDVDSIDNEDAAVELKFCEQRIIEAFNETQQVEVIYSDQISALYPEAKVFDPLAEKAGHIPYHSAYYAALSAYLYREIVRHIEKLKKVIVLDCDNTLWSGVCGEESLDKLKVSYPYRVFQHSLLQQKERGILLCITSKNNEEDVFNVLDNHPDMLLKRSDFVAHQINWKIKSENLKTLSKTLNLGLDSFIFIDDNPVECAEVREHCPSVVTLQLPNNAELIPRFVTHIWPFSLKVATEEDRLRVDHYQKNTLRQQTKATSPTLQDFLQDLHITIKIVPLEEKDIQRASQLTRRTNQFNLNPKIMQTAEFSHAQNWLSVSVSDRFGDYGFVGLMGYKMQNHYLLVNTFLLSCRALGLGVERRMLLHLIDTARQRGCRSVRLHYRKTEKNIPVRLFIESAYKEMSYSGPKESGYFEFPIHLFENFSETPREFIEYKEEKTTELEPTGFESNRSELWQEIADSLNHIDTICARVYKTSLTTNGGNDVEEQILNTIANVLKIENPDWTKTFFELGGTSLQAVTLISRIHERFKVSLSYEILLENPSLAKLCNYINGHAGESEFYIEHSAPVINTKAYFFPTAPRNTVPTEGDILLTGATGYLGAYLLNKLLCTQSCHIYCLVRAENETQAHQKIRHNLARYHLLSDETYKKVQPVLGDLRSNHLGIVLSEYDYLSDTITVIYHNAAEVNFLYPYSLLKHANVFATRDLLELALKRHMKAFHFISSTAIYDTGTFTHKDLILESSLTLPPIDIMGGYAQSKAAAEWLVYNAQKIGLPTTIYRPGIISDPNIINTGFPSKELFSELFQACVAIKQAPLLSGYIDFSPVDYIAKAVVTASVDEHSAGKILHLSHPKPITFSEFITMANSIGLEIQLVDFDTWLHTLEEYAHIHQRATLKNVLPIIKSDWFKTICDRPRFSCEVTLELLKNTNVECPEFQALLTNYRKASQS